MRKLMVLFFLAVVCAPALLAQSTHDRDRDRDRDDRWRDRRGRYDSRRLNFFELTPFGGFRYGGTLWADRSDLFSRDVDIASGANFGVNLGIPVGDTRMKLELMANRQATHFTGGSGLFDPDTRLADVDITHYHAGLQIPFGESNAISPFVILSAGLANIDPDIRNASAENRFSASAGGGLKVPITPNIGLRFEARGYFTSLSDESNNRRRFDDENHDLYQGETNLGLVISF